MEAKIKLIDNLQFVAITPSGHSLVMDTSGEGGTNTAGTPMELVLVALGGCTGMDVVSILRKMKIEFKAIEIMVKGERTDQHPKVYKKIEFVYKLYGKNVPEDRVRKAVELSQEKYCSVSAMLKPNVEIQYLVEIYNNE